MPHPLWARTKDALALVRLEPFDPATPEGRSRERYRRVLLTAAGSMVARALGLLTALITVPLTVQYLGNERYGMWTAISSTVALLSFADLGMANGLLNAVAEAHGRDDSRLAHQFISSAAALLGGVALLLAAAFGLAYANVPWAVLFNVSSPQAIAEAGPAVAAFVACFLLNIPLGIVQQVRLAYQEGFVNSLWQSGGYLLSLGGVLLAVQLRAGLPWLVLAMAGFPVVVAVANAVDLFWVRRPGLRPAWSAVSRAAARQLLAVGAMFFVLQIAAALGYQSDNLVIARILGAEQVTQYAVPLKLFTLAGLLLSFVLGPLWPAYREALARHDVDWVRLTLRRSIALGFALNVPAALFLMVFGQRLIELWVGPGVTASSALLLGLGLWSILNSLGGPLAMLLNGANAIGFQVVINLLMGVANLAISILLVQRIGVAGAIFGTVIAQVVFIFLPSAFYVPRLLARLQAAPRQAPGPAAYTPVDGFTPPA